MLRYFFGVCTFLKVLVLKNIFNDLGSFSKLLALPTHSPHFWAWPTKSTRKYLESGCCKGVMFLSLTCPKLKNIHHMILIPILLEFLFFINREWRKSFYKFLMKVDGAKKFKLSF